MKVTLSLSLIFAIGLSSASGFVGKSQHIYGHARNHFLVKLDMTAISPSSPDDLVKEDKRIQLLDDALKFDSSAASVLMTELQELRSSGAPESKVDQFVNDLLVTVDGNEESTKPFKLPFWTRFRPLSRFSRRARLASLRRVLDLSTPTPDETEDIGDSIDAARRRRRRSFLVLLRSLANAKDGDEGIGDAATPSEKKRNAGGIRIVEVEKAAIRENKKSVSIEDMESRLPPGLETPKYSVISRQPPSLGGYEIRKYEPFSVCSVNMNKPREDPSKTDEPISNPQLKGASSFGALAGYLFGKNQESTSMKMTTPVLSRGEGEEKTMSFVLPSDYWKEDGITIAPKPMEGSGVQLQRDEGGERAVVMFGGFAAKKDTEERKALLLDCLAKDSEWMADADSIVTVAQYNDPFTPPWKRRNEVSIKVVPRK